MSIYELNEEGKPVKEILSILKTEGIKISDKSIYNIIKEKTKNRSLTSFDEEEEEKISEKISNPFNESFGEENISLPTQEEKIHQQEDDIKDNLISIINKVVKEGTEQFTSI